MSDKIQTPSHDTMEMAAQIIRDGGIVAIPTETVYGLAADATNGEAVARIYAAKGRPSFNPLISHVPNLKMAKTLARFNDVALKMAEKFWPGPLTLVLPKSEDCPVSDLVTAGLDTIAIRIPNHPIARGLIETAQRPLAAPSANPSEALSPTTAQHVSDALSGNVDLILDGGACLRGVESTVVSLADKRPALLRPGALAREEIETITGPLDAPSEKIASPGMMRRHYAPNAKLRLNAKKPEGNEAYLGFGPTTQKVAANLSTSGDLIEAAANLFAMLRILDLQYGNIAVAPIPKEGLGEAINDRLKRAAV
ncbi:L-threonylcarbamoyladenylate synthase [Hirschia maritima]|uniref:L-threonylcarbamoyladenylate synthase n=1 Tax=Hirschia maritima TaxID=1121961 RepID=UPI00036ED591|nr:L-threonylcarbamoyladenylate synthase [Hirschia maritima]